jgi:two-component system chemotaxis response regulator CheY
MKPSRRILIVDDTEHAATTLEVALASIAGVSVCVAASASEALKILESAEAVSTIITDLNMPHMDGFELIARVRQFPRHEAVPIIVISADTDPRTPERLARLGAAAFFPKPYSPARVRQKVEQLLDAISASQSHTLR